MTSPALVSFEHLCRLTDDVGLFEHARFTQPRPEHGYCVDDVARGLVVVARQPGADPTTARLSQTYLRFLGAAQDPDGRFHNRLSVTGRWTDHPGVDDCWGRALWGLGTAAARAPWLGDEPLARFEAGARHRSPSLRSMVFGALGAADVLQRHPEHRPARSLLADAAHRVSGMPQATPGRTGAAVVRAVSAGTTASWPWPEPRLHYANAAIPEVLIAAGSLLDEPRWTAEGLGLLRWLLDVETRGDHLSVTPVGGWAPGEPRPGFDQQPIEVAALADACARASDVTGDVAWQRALVSCAAWFEGANDGGVAMCDAASGGGYDGLEALGRNENQGAESTLAMLTTFQHLTRLLVTAS